MDQDVNDEFKRAVNSYYCGRRIEAFKKFKKLAAPPCSFVDARLWLGRMYLLGQGIPENYDEARIWLNKAMLQGNWEAQSYLADMYRLGLGVSKSMSKAAGLYRNPAENGDPKSQFYLGMSFMKGDGVKHDLVRACMWFNLSSRQKHPLRKDAKRKRSAVMLLLSLNEIKQAQKASTEMFEDMLQAG